MSALPGQYTSAVLETLMQPVLLPASLDLLNHIRAENY